MIITVHVDDPDVRYRSIGHDVHRPPNIGDPGAIGRDLWINRYLEIKNIGVPELVVIGRDRNSCCQEQQCRY